MMLKLSFIRGKRTRADERYASPGCDASVSGVSFPEGAARFSCTA